MKNLERFIEKRVAHPLVDEIECEFMPFGMRLTLGEDEMRIGTLNEIIGKAKETAEELGFHVVDVWIMPLGTGYLALDFVFGKQKGGGRECSAGN